ncbi:hypothetical protein [Microvirga roseola]|uniref:hypothetical protein n=1 Tax=Microvirga roseola TaxID=2883126 RepID=UPI001E567B88|nr:hypothetical protein [Microvirga roseola]
MKVRNCIALAMLAGSLGACSTSANVFYGEFRSGPDFETGSFYERGVYGDTARGIGSEACRVEIRREVDAFGNVATHEVTACD